MEFEDDFFGHILLYLLYLLSGTTIEFEDDRGQRLSATYLPFVCSEQGWGQVLSLSLSLNLNLSLARARARSLSLSLDRARALSLSLSPPSFPLPLPFSLPPPPLPSPDIECDEYGDV
jgi:hypothetical protein